MSNFEPSRNFYQQSLLLLQSLLKGLSFFSFTMTCCDNSFPRSNVAVHWAGSNVLSSHLIFQTVLDDATTAWGIKVERVEMWVYCGIAVPSTVLAAVYCSITLLCVFITFFFCDKIDWWIDHTMFLNILKDSAYNYAKFKKICATKPPTLLP